MVNLTSHVAVNLTVCYFGKTWDGIIFLQNKATVKVFFTEAIIRLFQANSKLFNS